MTRSRAMVTAAIAVALLFVVAAAAGVAGGKQATSTVGSTVAGVTGGLGGPTWSGSLVVALVSAGGVWVIYSLLPGLFKRRPRRPAHQAALVVLARRGGRHRCRQ